MDRFVTIRALFEEFPTLQPVVELQPTDDHPVAFVKSLIASGKTREAVAICCFLLPKREAVWWICACLRSRPQLASDDPPALAAAEAWAREPNEGARNVAAQWGRAADQMAPATWAAHAAGFTSGNLSTVPDHFVRPPPHLTAESARVALTLAECKLDLAEVESFRQECVASALNYLEGRSR